MMIRSRRLRLRHARRKAISRRRRRGGRFGGVYKPLRLDIDAIGFNRWKASAMHRRMFLLTSVVIGVLPLAACAGLSTAELDVLGSKITPVTLKFDEIYSYADRSGAAYASEAVIRAKYPQIVRINAPGQSQVRYFLERDEKTRTQIITVRGTNNQANLDEDMEIRVRDDRQIALPVHSGFDQAARLIYQDVLPLLKPGYKTYVTGHSLGGAVAAILAIYLIEDGVKVERVVTFGQPRFTTAAGVERLSFLPLTRIVDADDIVPLVPPSFLLSDPRFGPFTHVGPEVILLEGPDFVYLPSHDATRIAIGEFWRSITFADLKDHDIAKYLRRIESKIREANEVPYTNRQKYVVANAKQVVR
jgi:hypothetical protein